MTNIGKGVIQLAAVIIGCIVILFILAPSNVTGVVDESVSKFIKAFAIFMQAIIYGAFSNGSE